MTGRWVEIGKVGVDSGLLLIGDPGLFVDRPTVPEAAWQAACGTEDIDASIAALFDGFFMFPTPAGDGIYPVEARIDSRDGGIVELRVRFRLLAPTTPTQSTRSTASR